MKIPRSLYLIVVSWVVSTPALADIRIAYVWGDQPTAADYAPSPGYVRTDDGEVRITRSAVGRYRVRLGSIVSNGGNVQVSAYGAEAGSCQVVNWNAGGANVACFGANGAPADRRFSLLAVRAGGASSVAYTWAGQPNLVSYVPSSVYTHAPGGTARIQRTGVGIYQVELARGILGAGANLQVTAYGSELRRCGLVTWGGDRAGVRCEDVAGRLADSAFALLAVKPEPGDRSIAFVWAEKPLAALYTPSRTYTYTPDGPASVRRTGTGRYLVTLHGPIGNVQATSYGGVRASCHPVSWGGGAARVACSGPDGAPIDAPFTVLAVRNPTASSPDLTVAFEGVSAELVAGQPLGAGARTVARNQGTGPAPGSRVGQQGYMIDVVLSTDTVVPEGFAIFNAAFREDVLLAGGRASNTTDLAPGGSARFSAENDTIPADTPPGAYRLCARIDPGRVVREADEANNLRCVQVKVVAPR